MFLGVCPFYLGYPACSCAAIHDALSESLLFLYSGSGGPTFVSDLSLWSSAVNIVGLSRAAFGFIYFLHCFSVLHLTYLCPTFCLSYLLPLKVLLFLFVVFRAKPSCSSEFALFM